jgi:hypothetical protein
MLARSLVALAEGERLRGNLARAETYLDACPAGERDWEWRHLSRLCRLRLAALDGPRDPVSSVAISPDGSIRIWEGSGRDLAWKLLRTLPGHQGLVSGLAFAPGSRRLASTGLDGKLIVWNALRGRRIGELPVRPARSEREDRPLSAQSLPGVAYSPRSQQVATPGRFGAVVLWNVETGAEELLAGHTGEVQVVAYSSDGRRLASGGIDGTVRLCDPARAEEVLTLSCHTRPLLALAFSGDGRFLATSAKDRTILVHEAPDAK